MVEVKDSDHSPGSVFELEPVINVQLIDVTNSLIKGGSASGWDDIPSKLIKNFSNNIIHLLLHLINL